MDSAILSTLISIKCAKVLDMLSNGNAVNLFSSVNQGMEIKTILAMNASFKAITAVSASILVFN